MSEGWQRGRSVGKTEIILWKGILVESSHLKQLLFLRGQKNNQTRISDQFSPPSCQARHQHRTLLSTKPQHEWGNTLPVWGTICSSQDLSSPHPPPRHVLPFMKTRLSVLWGRRCTLRPRAAVLGPPQTAPWAVPTPSPEHSVEPTEDTAKQPLNCALRPLFLRWRAGCQWAASIWVRDTWERWMAIEYSSVLLRKRWILPTTCEIILPHENHTALVCIKINLLLLFF